MEQFCFNPECMMHKYEGNKNTHSLYVEENGFRERIIMKVNIKWKWTKTIDRIFIENADHIDRTKLGAAIGVSKQSASKVILSGKVSEELLRKIRKVPFRSISTKRKLPTKKAVLETTSKGEC